MKAKTHYKLNAKTAAAFVIANMIGTGVFTSLGFQLLANTNATSIALIWLIGGITALCGAFVYSMQEKRVYGIQLAGFPVGS